MAFNTFIEYKIFYPSAVFFLKPKIMIQLANSVTNGVKGSQDLKVKTKQEALSDITVFFTICSKS